MKSYVVESAANRVFLKCDPGRARDAIRYLAELPLVRGQRFILFCRVSARTQRRNQHLQDQEAFLWSVVEKRGGVIVDVYYHTGSGWDVDEVILLRALRAAREHNAVLLAESTDRFARPCFYHSVKDKNAVATRLQIVELKQFTQGVVVATFVDPDASPKDVRRHQQYRGKWAKSLRAGDTCRQPGYKRMRRLDKKPQFRAMRAAGKSYREIARILGVAHSTLQGWK